MNSPIERIGIVGFGPMGQLVAEKMLPDMEITATDPRVTESPLPHVTMTDLATVARSDAVIMAVPARHLEQAVADVTQEMTPDTLLIDISSVKLYPSQVFQRLWHGEQRDSLLCHPLFGPQSAGNGLEGLNLIVTHESGDKAPELLQLWRQLGLNIVQLSADEHDRQMAEVHAKTFILGRLAHTAGDTPTDFNPPSHRAIEMLEALDAAHSPELFESIVQFNPHARKLFASMRAELDRIEQPDPAVAGLLDRYAGTLDGEKFN